jgi:predicted ATP-grasp superfamily ATP-dependent carboligase
MKVFVTDASYKQTLAAIRSLGQRGIFIIAGSQYRLAQGFWSKYCSRRVLYPDPRDEKRFVLFMEDYLTKNSTDVLLPIGYITSTIFSKHKAKFSRLVRIPIADYESMEIACKKDKTMELAATLGIAAPRTYRSAAEVKKFPVVIKGISESGHVRYVNSAKELAALDVTDTVIQEYIPGDGYGFYALYNDGQPRAMFMHKRIREYPITGGASSSAGSTCDPALGELGDKLLKALKWHGVAMVEFKKDRRDGQFKLMEINPKFWGSLDLAIASGVDFPWLAASMAAEGDIEPALGYNQNVKFRWLFPDDFLHVLANPKSAGAFIRDFFDPNVRGNIRLTDLKPTLIQLTVTFKTVLNRFIRGQLRYPHGKPEVEI